MIFSTYLGAGKSSAVYGTVIKHFGYLVAYYRRLHFDYMDMENKQKAQLRKINI